MSLLSRWRYQLLSLAILVVTGLAIVAVWPSEPDRYLPDAVPWPEGRGIHVKVPWIKDGRLTLVDLERRGMTLGLDLRGGTRLVLEPDPAALASSGIDIGDALDGAERIIERRINAFGVAESEISRLGNDRISVQVPGLSISEAQDRIGRTALLQICEPLTNDAGEVAIVRSGQVKYRPGSCEPARDAQGNLLVVASPTPEAGSPTPSPTPQEEFGPAPPTATPTPEGAAAAPETTATPAPQPTEETRPAEVEYVGVDQFDPEKTTSPLPRDLIVWKPATGDLNGVTAELTGRYLKPTTSVGANPTTGAPILYFEMNDDGGELLGQVTERLKEQSGRSGYPMAFFLDGEPIKGEDGSIIAPTVRDTITTQGTITGLSLDDARELRTLLNSGAFPVPLRIVQADEVDATLGDKTVRDSVMAGEVALLLIMLFMTLYYRMPGLLASLALVVYTSVVLAIFKIWPVTLTLAGIAAFVLSVGMAVDANILIFERMREELRLGRSLLSALDAGFSRAWSSIRDSNISTLITCAILYWFGDQFDAALVKGFAVTLAIGVIVSMISAISVTRTFLRVAVRTPAVRNLALWTADPPSEQGPAQPGVRPAPMTPGRPQE